jgi:hypothetical protein
MLGATPAPTLPVCLPACVVPFAARMYGSDQRLNPVVVDVLPRLHMEVRFSGGFSVGRQGCCALP